MSDEILSVRDVTFYSCRLFINPTPEVYEHTAYYKKHGKILGDLYWQGLVRYLGQRKDTVGSDDEEDRMEVEVPEVR